MAQIPFGVKPDTFSFFLLQQGGGGGGPITLADLPSLSQPGAVYLMGTGATMIEYTQPDNTVMLWDSGAPGGVISAAFPPDVTFDKLPALQPGEIYIGATGGVPTVLPPGPDDFFPYYDSSATNGIASTSRFQSLSTIQDPLGSINFVFPAAASGTFTFTDQGFNVNGNSATIAPLRLRNSNATAGAPLVIGRSASNQPFLDIVKATTGDGAAIRLYNGNTGALLHSLTADTVANLLELAAAGALLVKAGGVDVARLTANGLRLLDGTVANPALNFNGDTTTGLSRSPSGIIASIAAAQKLLIAGNGIFPEVPIYPPTSSPTIAAGNGAGVSPSISLASGSTAFSGIVNLTVGSGPTLNGTIFTLTFNLSTALTTAPGFLVLPANAATANILARFFVGATGVTTTTASLTNGNTALTASSVLAFRYALIINR